jgi:hypothetical protein
MATSALDARQHRATLPQWQAAQSKARSLLPQGRFLGDIGRLAICEWRAGLPAQAVRIFIEEIK